MNRKRSISLRLLSRLGLGLALLVGLCMVMGGLTRPAYAAGTPPVLNLPGPITAEATGPQGAIVTYTATAYDVVDGSVPVNCAPPSGGTLPIGNTTVKCSATDSSGNIGTGSFTVIVQPALTISGISVSASEGSAFSGVVATGMAHGTTGTLTVSIDWGDGSSSMVNVTPATDGSYSVSASHTYYEEGQDTIHITVSDGSVNTASATSSMSVSDAGLTLQQFAVGQGKHLTAGLAALFTDADPAGVASDYQASIAWGDGTASTVSVYKNPLGAGFVLAGQHNYAHKGTYTVTLTLSDQGGSQLSKTASVTVS